MNVNLKIVSNGVRIPISNALIDGKITIDNNCIIAKKDTSIHISTGIVDEEGLEIYDGDILVDSNNMLFKVIYQYGAFYIQEISPNSKGYITPIFMIQSFGHITAKIKE